MGRIKVPGCFGCEVREINFSCFKLRSAVSVGRHRGHVVGVEFRFSAGAHGQTEIAVG